MIEGFLNTVGKRIAERWTGLLGPAGVLFVAAVWTGELLGDAHALDVARLVDDSAALVAGWGRASVVAVVAIVALIVAASAASLAAWGLGDAVQRCWLASGPDWWVRLGVEGRLGRRARWEKADAAFRAAVPRGDEPPAELRRRRGRLVAARNRIALAPPMRPTWIGDRLRVVGERVDGQYALDLAAAWPRLWLVVPDTTRTELRAAQESFASAATQIGWAVLYVILGAALWWPALAIALLLTASGWRAGRAAAEALASLAESAVDVHLADLARSLDLMPTSGTVTPAIGRDISERLRKGT